MSFFFNRKTASYLLLLITFFVSEKILLAKESVYSLEKLVELSLKNSDELKIEDLETGVIDLKKKQAENASFMPEIKGRGYLGLSPARTLGSDLDEVGQFFEDLGVFSKFDIRILQPIYTFGRLKHLKEIASNGKLAQKHKKRIKLREVGERVSLLYVGMIYGEEVLDVLNEVSKRLVEAEERYEKKIDSGDGEVTMEDLLKIRIKKASLEEKKAAVVSRLSFARKTLKILCGLEKEPVLEDRKLSRLRKKLSKSDSKNEVSYELLPELKALNFAGKAKKSELEMHKSSNLPQFFLGLEFNYSISTNERFKKPADPNCDYSSDKACLGEYIRSNSYDFLKDYGAISTRDSFDSFGFGWVLGFEQNLAFHLSSLKVNQKKAEHAKLLAQSKAARTGLKISHLKLKEDYKLAKGNRKSLKKGFKAARNLFRISAQNLELDLVSSGDLISSYTSYIEAKVLYLAAQHKELETKIKLRRFSAE